MLSAGYEHAFADLSRVWATGSYQSGFYDDAQALLKTDSANAFNRALGPMINATVPGGNAVMVYERVTGTCAQDMSSCNPAYGPLNDYILFDNRIPPRGFDYAQYRQAGVKFCNYDPATFVPYEEYNSTTGQTTRYPNGQYWDDLPLAAMEDTALYELLALFDALRAGQARERELAKKLLEERLRSAKSGSWMIRTWRSWFR